MTLQDSAQVYHTSFDQAFQIKDLRGSQEGWRLDVSASPFSNGDHDLPSGSLGLVPLDSIVRVGAGSGGLPSNSMTGEMIIDAGTIEVAKANVGSGMGAFDLTFPSGALSLVVDATTAKVGTYESTLTWDLVAAP